MDFRLLGLEPVKVDQLDWVFYLVLEPPEKSVHIERGLDGRKARTYYDMVVEETAHSVDLDGH